jgi:hypothetical protein
MYRAKMIFKPLGMHPIRARPRPRRRPRPRKGGKGDLASISRTDVEDPEKGAVRLCPSGTR